MDKNRYKRKDEGWNRFIQHKNNIKYFQGNMELLLRILFWNKHYKCKKSLINNE